MNYLVWLLFSFQGRINRSTFWAFFVSSVVLLIVVFNLTVDQQALQQYLDMAQQISDLAKAGDQAGAQQLAESLPPFPLPNAVIVLSTLLLWPTFAVQAKRFRDRNRPVGLVALNLLGFSTVLLGGFGLMLHLSAQIWILIECGFMPSRNPPAAQSHDDNDSATFEG